MLAGRSHLLWRSLPVKPQEVGGGDDVTTSRSVHCSHENSNCARLRTLRTATPRGKRHTHLRLQRATRPAPRETCSATTDTEGRPHSDRAVRSQGQGQVNPVQHQPGAAVHTAASRIRAHRSIPVTPPWSPLDTPVFWWPVMPPSPRRNPCPRRSRPTASRSLPRPVRCGASGSVRGSGPLRG